MEIIKSTQFIYKKIFCEKNLYIDNDKVRYRYEFDFLKFAIFLFFFASILFVTSFLVE